jgi:hypothetical protein
MSPFPLPINEIEFIVYLSLLTALTYYLYKPKGDDDAL